MAKNLLPRRREWSSPGAPSGTYCISVTTIENSVPPLNLSHIRFDISPVESKAPVVFEYTMNKQLLFALLSPNSSRKSGREIYEGG